MNEVDKYLNNLDQDQKLALQRIRSVVKEVVPEAEEVISYGMPVFKYRGKYLIGYAAFKNHMSVFPGTEPIELIRDKLKDKKISKGTVQFTIADPLSKSILVELIEARKKAIDNNT